MADLWIPGFTRVNLGVGGGYYDETAHPKFLWHMTQGSSLAGARNAFKSYPPHCGVDWRTGEREQYIPLNWHSWSLRGDESDDEICIQVEVVGFSEDAHNLPDSALEWLGVYVVRPIHELVPIPYQHLRFYGADEGIVLASPNSPIRLSDAAFRDYSGHLAHQHVPKPDEHWDAGPLNISKILSYAVEGEMSVEDLERMVYKGGPVAGSVAAETLIQNVRDLQALVWKGGGVTGSIAPGSLMGDVRELKAEVAGLADQASVDALAAAVAEVRSLLTDLAGPGVTFVPHGQITVVAESGQPD